MKTIILSLAILFSVGLSAQNDKPVFEKDGDMVRATYYHQNGVVAQTGHFLEGKLHGKWKMYNVDGKKIALGEYNQGVRTGKWFFWEGEVLKEVDFVDNKIASVNKWNNSSPVVLNK